MKAVDLKELKEAAEKAMPGEWEPKTIAEWQSGFDFFGGADKAFVFPVDLEPEDVAYIRAAQPSTILSLIERVTRAEAYAREASEALLKTRPLGGSEMFKRFSGEEYLADPSYCGGLIDQLRSDLHEARVSRKALTQTPASNPMGSGE